MAYGGRADVPMSEFWTGRARLGGQSGYKEMASAGHVYGKPSHRGGILYLRRRERQVAEPSLPLKPLGDMAFTQGINRFVFHRYSMQPWLDRKPGMTWARWACITSAPTRGGSSRARGIAYLARCQALLQSGQFVADVACLGSENAPQIFPEPGVDGPRHTARI